MRGWFEGSYTCKCVRCVMYDVLGLLMKVWSCLGEDGDEGVSCWCALVCALSLSCGNGNDGYLRR